MDESNVYSKWKHVCVNNEERIRICMQGKDLWMEYLRIVTNIEFLPTQ